MNVRAELDKATEPVVTISTSHLSEATKEWLSKDLLRRDGKMAGMEWDYGWMLFVGNWDEDTPEDLACILKTCNDYAYSWVRFDCDAPACRAFPEAS
jgi:hypothetical protein